jgi:hypothetical protein
LSACSILSKYGVHGFPTLFLLNSTMRVRYQGSRTLGSLVSFYSDETGKPFQFGSYYGLLFWILNLLVYDELLQLVVDETKLKE